MGGMGAGGGGGIVIYVGALGKNWLTLDLLLCRRANCLGRQKQQGLQQTAGNCTVLSTETPRENNHQQL